MAGIERKTEPKKNDVPEKPESGLVFQLKSVKKKPDRRYRKGSKYDPIIEAFLKQPDNLVKVELPDKDGNYVRTQLNKRIEALDLKDTIKCSVINDVCYLERK